MFNDLIKKNNNIINNLENKINQQPYIISNNVKMYFKNPSSELEVKQLNDTSFSLKYYHHNVKYNVQNIDDYNGDIHEKIEYLVNDIDKYISDVEKEQIIKELIFDFDIDTNSNFNDKYLVNSLFEKYITNDLNNKYKQYIIKNQINESTDQLQLYSIELESNNSTIIEYYLLFNVFCIKLTQTNYINDYMKDLINKMLLSLTLSKDYQNYFLNFTKENLINSFEINDIENNSIQNNYIEENKDDNIYNKKLEKFATFLKNYSKVDNDVTLNVSQIFNFLLLGNDSKEKDEIVEDIQSLFKKYKFFGDKLELFYIDIKSEIYLNKNILNILTRKANSNIIYIKNFDYLNSLDNQNKSAILNYINNYKESNNPKCIIISGKEQETKDILSQFNNLLNNFSYIIVFDDYSIDTIYDVLISKLNGTNYKIKLNENITKEKLKKIYKLSEEKNDTFINRIYTKMVKYVFENDLDEFNDNCLPNISDENNINNSINELNDLIGLDEIKNEIKKLISFWKYMHEIEKKTNIQYTDISLNMFLTGNPGTGKTTVARILSNILYNLEYVKEDKFIEVTPNDFVADYEGQTKTKTKEILSQAKNGVLFIDEAYLFLNTEGSYFREALVEILKYLEDTNNIVFFAGYSKQMKKFIDINPGLKSRIGYFLNFEDYKLEELLKILQTKLKKKGLTIEQSALEKLTPIIEEQMKIKDFGNARYIDKLFNNIMIKHSENLDKNYNEDKLLIIDSNDINKEELINNELKSKNSFGFISDKEM